MRFHLDFVRNSNAVHSMPKTVWRWKKKKQKYRKYFSFNANQCNERMMKKNWNTLSAFIFFHSNSKISLHDFTLISLLKKSIFYLFLENFSIFFVSFKLEVECLLSISSFRCAEPELKAPMKRNNIKRKTKIEKIRKCYSKRWDGVSIE